MEKPPFKVRMLSWLVTIWIRSLRIRRHAPADFRPGIIGVWHQDLIACAAAFKGMGVHAMVSESGDGEFFANTIERLGYRLTRGSDTHGATNVRHLLKTLEKDGFVGMALDGPRGPAHKVKEGSTWLAQKSNRPLWLIDVHYGAHITLKTWDNFILPLPLTAIDIQIKYLCT